MHLRERRADLRWFVPAFWAELVETHGQRAPWPDDLDLGEPRRSCASSPRGLWLEQEPLVVDARILQALEALL